MKKCYVLPLGIILLASISTFALATTAGVNDVSAKFQHNITINLKDGVSADISKLAFASDGDIKIAVADGKTPSEHVLPVRIFNSNPVYVKDGSPSLVVKLNGKACKLAFTDGATKAAPTYYKNAAPACDGVLIGAIGHDSGDNYHIDINKK